MTDTDSTPTDWLTGHAALLPAGGDALDIACGRGRHALWLAHQGLRVTALDRHEEAIAALAAAARERALPIAAHVVDLERPGADLGRDAYDVIVGVHYLHRPLFPALVAALRPGGMLIYETFTRAQARRGKPTNPAFLLEPGELRTLTAGLTVIDEREGEFGKRDVAAIVCRKPPTPQ
jgi:2-polyprenyl-3-methyl-5-hydroxy-6-metoxy-1,4-benzoquinol methylase